MSNDVQVTNPAISMASASEIPARLERHGWCLALLNKRLSTAECVEIAEAKLVNIDNRSPRMRASQQISYINFGLCFPMEIFVACKHCLLSMICFVWKLNTDRDRKG